MSILDNWLNSQIYGTTSLFDNTYLPSDNRDLLPQFNGLQLRCLYDEETKDSDLINNPTDLIEELEYNHNNYLDKEEHAMLSDSLEVYDSKKVLILPGSIRSHVSYLYKKIILLQKYIDVKLQLPEIIKTNSKTVVITCTIDLFSAKNKHAFYKFCFDNSSTNKKYAYSSLPVVVPPIVTKKMIGEINLRKEIEKENEKKCMREKKEQIKPITGLTYEQLTKCYDDLIDQYDVFNNFVNDVWDQIFKEYIDEKNFDKVILDKIRLINIQKIYSFFQSLPQYEKMNKLYDRLMFTIKKMTEEIKQKDKIEKEKKIKEQEQEQKQHTKISVEMLTSGVIATSNIKKK